MSLLWNTVPAHPHPEGKPLGNRAPTMPERRAGGEALALFLDVVRPLAIVPVGRVAEKAMSDLGVATLPAVRHPAQGGATQFRVQAGAALRAFSLTA